MATAEGVERARGGGDRVDMAARAATELLFIPFVSISGGNWHNSGHCIRRGIHFWNKLHSIMRAMSDCPDSTRQSRSVHMYGQLETQQQSGACCCRVADCARHEFSRRIWCLNSHVDVCTPGAMNPGSCSALLLLLYDGSAAGLKAHSSPKSPRDQGTRPADPSS